MEVEKCRNSSPYIKYFMLSKYWNPAQDNQCPERAGEREALVAILIAQWAHRTASICWLKINLICYCIILNNILNNHTPLYYRERWFTVKYV